MSGLLIRNVEIESRAGLDVRVENGRIAEIGPRLGGRGPEVDGHGGALIAGLTDHHIHLYALAAQADSISLDGVTGTPAFAARIAEALKGRPPGDWVRVTGYHETMAGELDREVLDALAPAHRLRVQHQTGSLWVLNSLAFEGLGDADDPVVERSGGGRATGRIWRGDRFLRDRIGAIPPRLAPIGRRLAAYGITALTDASVTTDVDTAEAFAAAVRSGALPQRLRLMSGGPLAVADDAISVGEVKVLLDDHDLPDLDDFVARIGQARRWGRGVAVHCVTAAELAVALAAFETAGARPGDRIEHGGVIAPSAIGQLRALGLTVVTQPGFVRERGDRYLAEVDPAEQADLYRCASLLAAGVPVAASSDAPYASPDPWAGMAAAVDRKTRTGRGLGGEERLAPARALALYQGDPASPGAVRGPLTPGDVADLCLLKTPLRDALAAHSADLVAATLCAGTVAFEAT